MRTSKKSQLIQAALEIIDKKSLDARVKGRKELV